MRSWYTSQLWVTVYTLTTQRSVWRPNHLAEVGLFLEEPEGGGLAMRHKHLFQAASNRREKTLKGWPLQVGGHDHLPMDATTTEAVAGVGEVAARALFGEDCIDYIILSL